MGYGRCQRCQSDVSVNVTPSAIRCHCQAPTLWGLTVTLPPCRAVSHGPKCEADRTRSETSRYHRLTKPKTEVRSAVTATGKTRKFRDQVYKCIGLEPYERIDGSRTMLSLWRSACAECGRPFVTSLPAKARRFEPNRRCREHRRPGVRVVTRPEPRLTPKLGNRSGK